MKNDVYDLNIAKETQVKDSRGKVVVKFLVLALLLALLTISYIFCFYRSLYPGFLKYKLDGTFDARHYFGASATDLVVIEPYKNVFDAQTDDIVCFYTSAYRGSGKLLNIDGNVFVLETRQGDTIRIGSRFVVGKQTNTIAFLGILFAIYFSYYGAGILTAATLAYCLYLTFSRINYENTDEGKNLLKRYRQEKEEIKKRKVAFAKMKELGDVQLVVGSILEGNFEENKQKFCALNSEIKGSAKDKYKYILSDIHEAYAVPESLSKVEEENVTSLVELMCEAKEVDSDIQYMLCDLLLKTQLVDFESEKFMLSAREMLDGELTDDDKLNFITVIYLMLMKNTKLRNDDFVAILGKFNEKTSEMAEENKEIALEYSKNALKFIKT